MSPALMATIGTITRPYHRISLHANCATTRKQAQVVSRRNFIILENESHTSQSVRGPRCPV